MSEVDLSQYRFSKTHEWVKRDGDAAVVGVTDHAQVQLGDVIFLDLPEVGTDFKAGERFGTIESVKAASELYAPVSGTVADVNRTLTTTPEAINNSPYTDGWILRLERVDESGSELMDSSAYAKLVGEA